MSLARYLSKLGALLNSSGQVGATGLQDAAVTAAKLASGAARANFGAGAVLQVVQSTLTSTVTFTSGTIVATGLSASITPSSSSSKILVLFNGGGYDYAGGGPARGDIYLYKNAASLAFLGTRVCGNPTWALPYSESYLDSPATASAITYAIYGSNSSGGVTNFIFNDAFANRATLTLMEIAG